MNVQKKDANWSLERRLAAGVLKEMFKYFKACTIQPDKQVDKIIDSGEHVDARNWLRNDSVEQVDAISYSEKLVVDGSDPKSDPSVATRTTNVISTQKLLINPTIRVVVGPNIPLVAAGVDGAQDSLSLRQTVLLQANVTDVVHPCARIYRTTGKVIGTERDSATPRDTPSSKMRSRLSFQSQSS